MFDWVPQEFLKSMGSAAGGGALVYILVRVMDKWIPDQKDAIGSEQVFRSDLLKRITALESDRDRLAREWAEVNARYWELSGKYDVLKLEHERLLTLYNTLEEERKSGSNPST